MIIKVGKSITDCGNVLTHRRVCPRSTQQYANLSGGYAGGPLWDDAAYLVLFPMRDPF